VPEGGRLRVGWGVRVGLHWSKTYKVKCCDGSVKIVYRNIDDALPFAVYSPSASIKASVDSTPAASRQISGDYQRKVDGLLVGLDSKNNALMQKFRAAYVVYQTDPCGNGKKFAKEVARLTEQHDRLSILEIGVNGLVELARSNPDQTAGFMPMFRELARELAPYSLELRKQIANIEVKEARSDAARWIESGDTVSGTTDDDSEGGER
jgi:hypothetical protein